MACYCVTHAKNNDLYFDLVKENKFTVINFIKGDYEETVLLKCNGCDKKWKYHYTDSFHSPIVSWNKDR